MLVLFDIGSDRRFSFVIAGVNYDVICSADNFQWKIWWNRENKKNQNSIGNSIKNMNYNYFLMELLMDILLKEFDELELDSSPFCPSFCFAKKKKTATPTPIFSQIEPPQITGVDLNLSKVSTSLSWFNLFMICMLEFV